MYHFLASQLSTELSKVSIQSNRKRHAKHHFWLMQNPFVMQHPVHNLLFLTPFLFPPLSPAHKCPNHRDAVGVSIYGNSPSACDGFKRITLPPLDARLTLEALLLLPLPLPVPLPLPPGSYTRLLCARCSCSPTS